MSIIQWLFSITKYPNITIRNFFIAVRRGARDMSGSECAINAHARSTRAASQGTGWQAGLEAHPCGLTPRTPRPMICELECVRPSAHAGCPTMRHVTSSGTVDSSAPYLSFLPSCSFAPQPVRASEQERARERETERQREMMHDAYRMRVTQNRVCTRFLDRESSICGEGIQAATHALGRWPPVRPSPAPSCGCAGRTSSWRREAA